MPPRKTSRLDEVTCRLVFSPRLPIRNVSFHAGTFVLGKFVQFVARHVKRHSAITINNLILINYPPTPSAEPPTPSTGPPPGVSMEADPRLTLVLASHALRDCNTVKLTLP